MTTTRPSSGIPPVTGTGKLTLFRHTLLEPDETLTDQRAPAAAVPTTSTLCTLHITALLAFTCPGTITGSRYRQT